MQKNIFLFLALAFLTTAILSISVSCKHQNGEIPDPNPNDTLPVAQPCDPDTVYFVNTILPLLQSGCAMSGCHDAASAADGVVLTDYSRILSTAEVRPGDPDESKLYKVITDDEPEDRMPPPPRMAFTAEQIAQIRTWIQQGAKNNACKEDGCDSVNVSFASHIFPVIQNQCMGCHSGNNPSGGILLTNHSQIAAIATNNNRLLGAVKHLPGYSAMPPSGKLDACNIAKINKWINDGTPNN